MLEFFNLQFLLGLIFGGLIVFGIYPYLFKKKEEDLTTFGDNLQKMHEAIKGIKKDNDEYQGTLKEKLDNFFVKKCFVMFFFVIIRPSLLVVLVKHPCYPGSLPIHLLIAVCGQSDWAKEILPDQGLDPYLECSPPLR